MGYSAQAQELVRYCVSSHFEQRKFPLSVTKLQKMIYKTKQKLAETNPLKKEFHFYWYIHGPFSPQLYQLKDDMVSENIIQENEKGLTSIKNRICEHDDALKEARSEINDIINELSAANSTTIIEDLYASEAPYGFYISFKSRFHSTLHNFLNDPETRFKSEDVVSTLHTTIGELPNVPLFSSFKYSFLDFVEITEQILNSKAATDFRDVLADLTNKIFLTFAKGVRILHHDPYYDDKVEEWKEEFRQSINEMEKKIDDLYKKAKSLDIKDVKFVPINDLVEDVTKLKNNQKLIMVTFLPPIDLPEFNRGSIDGSIFKKLSDTEFQDLLCKFAHSRKAIVQYAKGTEMDTTKYKIMAS